VITAYAGNPAANRDAFEDGWFRTGDIGHFDADGYLTLAGRIKEIINCGGEKIAPAEVDAILLSHPSVSQCVTFAAPSKWFGEEPNAAVVFHAGAEVSERELKSFVGERLADFKVPRRILSVREIPLGPTGKIQRMSMARQLGLA
jgi:acyl-CoA synthetase (AMP-forming)/AMP-acid ligase II